MYTKGVTGYSTFNYLNNGNQIDYGPGYMHILPKIHRLNESELVKINKYGFNIDNIKPPCRPIISQIGTVTEFIGRYIDYFLVPMVQKQHTYIKDTSALIYKLERIKPNADCWLCSSDVVSMYTNCPINELLSAFIDDLNLNAFTIVSVDNIDFGQPNACLRLNGSRGIHATSYQAVQPKPKTIKFQNVDVKSRSNAINKDLELLNFSLSETEENAMSQTEKSMFQYIIKKLASDDGDISIPDLKSNLAAFGESNH
ncbi:unnamed protein product [Mytilus coruscus]|uniref:Reverse transcriptase domain-containing protein n=1 Tax=Mytilus coruscus TaxID=42192 RepID=A0A6J8E9B4_MYTCO|nr:unnamed protein product [Mytilus coruscus]